MKDNCVIDTWQWAQAAQLSGRNFIVILLHAKKWMESWISQHGMIHWRNQYMLQNCLLGCGPYPIYCMS